MTEERLAVVTGTSRGLGLSIAQRLLNDGFAVVGISRSAAPSAIAGNERMYHHIAYDLGDSAGIPSLVQDIIRAYGTPFALVNNAGTGLDGLLPTMHNSEIASLIEVNLIAPIIMTKYVSRHMLARRAGRIVNVSSVVATTGYRGLSVYAATKAGLQGFTRSLARDLGPRGITVNCVAPGFLETDMTASLGTDSMARIKKRAALGRFPRDSEVAGAISFLLSRDAEGITGTTLTIDAGNSA